jgi:hypothetical protein
MRIWRRLDRWAARVNPGLAVVAAVLALVDGSIVLGKQATRPLTMDRAARIAAVSSRRPVAAPRQDPDHDQAPPAAKVAEARPSIRQIYAAP